MASVEPGASGVGPDQGQRGGEGELPPPPLAAALVIYKSSHCVSMFSGV